MRLRLFLAGLALGMAVLVAGPAPPARACSCVPPSIDMLRDADAAFIGVYGGRTRVDTPAAGDQPVLVGGQLVEHHFAVQRVVKGDIAVGRVDVLSPDSGASCGFELSPGSRTGVLLYRRDGAWTSGLCSTLPVEMLAAAPTQPGSSGGDSGPDVAPMLALGLAAIGMAVLGEKGGRPGG